LLKEELLISKEESRNSDAATNPNPPEEKARQRSKETKVTTKGDLSEGATLEKATKAPPPDPVDAVQREKVERRNKKLESETGCKKDVNKPPPLTPAMQL